MCIHRPIILCIFICIYQYFYVLYWSETIIKYYLLTMSWLNGFQLRVNIHVIYVIRWNEFNDLAAQKAMQKRDENIHG